MRVTVLAAQEDLHEANALLDQAACQQAALAVFGRGRVVQAVEPARLFALPGNVQHGGHRRLHARRQLVVIDAGLQLRIGRMAA